jgi:proline racemase
LKLETPAGLISVDAEVSGGKCRKVTFRNVPAFAAHLDRAIEVAGLGTVTVDVAYGGMFYVIADAGQFGLTLAPGDAREIVRIAELVKTAAQEQLPVSHPENPRIAGVSIAELTYGQRNAVVVSTRTGSGVLDRSPCGTGTCARMAVLHAKGKLGLREDFVHEGILGTKFVGRLVEETKVGEHDAVVPTLSGQGWITGFAQYVLDPEDPFPEGFTVGDIW